MTDHNVGTINTKDMREISFSMSNLDGEIDDGFAEALQAEPGKVFGTHTAWDFYGKVYFMDGKFHEEVWVNRSPRKTISASTLRELMNDVCDYYGHD